MGRIGDGGSTILSYVFGIGGLLLPALALALGFLALRDIEGNPRVSGRAVAITGSVTAAIGIVWSVAMMLVLAGRPLLE
jgi:MFS-type transporter involved in bile tolerance (Atg22 family)